MHFMAMGATEKDALCLEHSIVVLYDRNDKDEWVFDANAYFDECNSRGVTSIGVVHQSDPLFNTRFKRSERTQAGSYRFYELVRVAHHNVLRARRLPQLLLACARVCVCACGVVQAAFVYRDQMPTKAQLDAEGVSAGARARIHLLPVGSVITRQSVDVTTAPPVVRGGVRCGWLPAETHAWAPYTAAHSGQRQKVLLCPCHKLVEWLEAHHGGISGRGGRASGLPSARRARVQDVEAEEAEKTEEESTTAAAGQTSANSSYSLRPVRTNHA